MGSTLCLYKLKKKQHTLFIKRRNEVINMKFKTQTLASAIIADAKSTVTDELEDLVFKSMLAEHMDSIVDGAQ